jgi:hypothetical protein
MNEAIQKSKSPLIMRQTITQKKTTFIYKYIEVII